MLAVQFGFGAMNMGQSSDGSDARPSAFVSVENVAIQRVPEAILSSVDAAQVNPAPPKRKTKKTA